VKERLHESVEKLRHSVRERQRRHAIAQNHRLTHQQSRSRGQRI
jgi:hypothetical protein